MLYYKPHAVPRGRALEPCPVDVVRGCVTHEFLAPIDIVLLEQVRATSEGRGGALVNRGSSLESRTAPPDLVDMEPSFVLVVS